MISRHFVFISVRFYSVMNKRFVIVGVALGIIVTIAVLAGSPAGPFGFDSFR